MYVSCLVFPLEAEGSSPGSAASLVLCSGFDSGELKTAVYMLRLDQSFNVLYMFMFFNGIFPSGLVKGARTCERRS